MYQRRNSHSGNNRLRNNQRGNHVKDNSGLISAFIEKSQQNSQPGAQIETQVTRSFSDFSFQKDLQRNLEKLGFTLPTPVQDAAIDQIVAGKDVVGVAHTGTGKTGAFLIPLIDRLIQDLSQKIIIVAPTRELALQTLTVFKDLTQGLGLYAVGCIGGNNINAQISQLRKGVHAIIGTPGRILDLIDRRKLHLHECTTVVLDEVDRMLDMGFINDIKNILKLLPTNKQSLYFSATMNSRVSQLISELSTSVYQVSLKTAGAVKTVDQEIIKYQAEENKFKVLDSILQSNEVTKSVIFGRTKRGVKKLAQKLENSGYKIDSIHGNKSQNQRRRALQSFRDSQIDILVATDVAARGLDVDDISHVFNYDLPLSIDDYIHRIGRTGRAGKKGVAYTFMK